MRSTFRNALAAVCQGLHGQVQIGWLIRHRSLDETEAAVFASMTDPREAGIELILRLCEFDENVPDYAVCLAVSRMLDTELGVTGNERAVKDLVQCVIGGRDEQAVRGIILSNWQ